MKQAIRKFFVCIALCALLTGFAGRTSSATVPYTAFSVLVTDGDSNIGVGYANVKIGSISKQTNQNGVMVFDLSFAQGEEKQITASKDGKKGTATVKETDAGSTIKVQLH